jgi:4-amino-4-deoxy-L-arabinose transferase-like glycosyltransferase
MFKRLRSLWKDGGDGVSEASEVRFRTLVLGLAAVTVPPLVLYLYYKLMFAGLSHYQAMDFAQLARNLSTGKGFTTYLLRPLALTHGDNPLAQPELTHGPLYPLLLALAFGLLGAKDWVVAAVSGFFYLLTIPVLYRLGNRVFGRSVALVTVLIFTFNALVLQYAVSGLHLTLYIFIATSLLLAVHGLACAARDRAVAPRRLLLRIGVLAALLYLTEPVFFWVLPVILVTVMWLSPAHRARAAGWFALPLCVLVLPWMCRNALLAGNPVFGLRGMELWMYTRLYPGETAYQLTPGELVPGIGTFKAVAQKILLGTGRVIQAFPQVTASWVLAFFLPGLLFQFADPAANTLRRVTMFSFLAILMGTLLFGLEMPLFVALIPVMLVYSVAFLIHLAREARLGKGSMVLVTGLMAVAVLYPLFSETTLTQRPEPINAVATARALAAGSRAEEVVLSDQPWFVAWYAERPSLWLPATERQLKASRERFAGARWLFLTDSVRQYSPEWQIVYDTLQGWGSAYNQARLTSGKLPERIRLEGKQRPLYEALQGFAAVAPTEERLPSAVVAEAPRKDAQVSLRPGSGLRRRTD